MYYTITVPKDVQKDIKEVYVVPVGMLPDFALTYKLNTQILQEAQQRQL